MWHPLMHPLVGGNHSLFGQPYTLPDEVRGYRLSRCGLGPTLRKCPALQNCLVVVRMRCPHDIWITEAGV
eukprot:15348436-Ditylum_brightwellii.AAC.1